MANSDQIIAYARETGNCPRCKGSGRLSEAGYGFDCPGCDGSGDWDPDDATGREGADAQ